MNSFSSERPSRPPATSTFPPASASSHHDLLKSDESGLTLAALDFDGTLYRPRHEKDILLTEFTEYIESQHPELTVKSERAILREIFNRWRDDEITDYNDMIRDSSMHWGLSLKDKKVEDIENVGREFMDRQIPRQSLENSDSHFYGYVKPMIQTFNEYGISPVLITGAPEELLPKLRELLGIRFSLGMKIEKEGGYYTGNSPYRAYAGQKIAKDGMVKKLVQEKKHAIAFGMGNSSADEPLVSAGIESRATHDLYGAGLIVNANRKDEDGFKEYRFSNAADWQFETLGPDVASTKVIQAVRSKIWEVLSFSRNMKKTRDLLFEKGLSPEEVEERMMRFHPDDEVRETIGKKMLALHTQEMMSRAGITYTDIQRLLALSNGENNMEADFLKRLQEAKRMLNERG